jgi:hypothetical protein
MNQEGQHASYPNSTNPDHQEQHIMTVCCNTKYIYCVYSICSPFWYSASPKSKEARIKNPHAKKMNHIFADLCTLLSSPMLCHVGLDIYEGVSWVGRTCMERRPMLFPFQYARIFCDSCRESEFCGPRCRKSSAPPTVPFPFLSTIDHHNNTNIDCLCVQVVGRIVLVPHCPQEQR